IAMKTVGNAMAKMHQGDRPGRDIGGVEHLEIAAVLPRAPDCRQLPAIGLRRIIAARDEDRFGDGVVRGQDIVADALAAAIDSGASSNCMTSAMMRLPSSQAFMTWKT